MAVLVWDAVGERYYETGVEHGVLYPRNNAGAYPLGVAWNGLVSVTEAPEGAEPTPIYADNIKYLNLLSVEEFAATIEAFTYPAEFEPCDGQSTLDTGIVLGQQERQQFGFSFKSKLGNDVEGNAHGYKIHIVYGALASPSEKGYQTINDTPEPITFSWEISTTPVAVTNHGPTAHLVIDSTQVDPADLALIEDALYGTAVADPYLPLPDEILALITP